MSTTWKQLVNRYIIQNVRLFSQQTSYNKLFPEIRLELQIFKFFRSLHTTNPAIFLRTRPLTSSKHS